MNGPVQIRELDLQEWERLFPSPSCIFDSAAFLALNAGKCERIVALVAEEGETRLGIVAGLRKGTLHAPFSAPFSAIETVGSPSLELRLRFAKALADYPLELTLPPACYNPYEETINRAALTEAGFLPVSTDLNYHLPLRPAPHMIPTARNKAARARRAGMRFEECCLAQLDEVYETIRRNREMRGFPLRMTAEQLRATAPVASARLFALRRPNGKMAASAVVYRSSPWVWQLIYWGHTEPTPGVMNLLAQELTAELSRNPETDIFDLGPASDSGKLLPGLARFKSSLGALPTSKTTYRLNTSR